MAILSILTRKPGPGRTPNPRLVPAEDLLYVQVVKQYKQYRVVKVTQKVVFGDSEKDRKYSGCIRCE